MAKMLPEIIDESTVSDAERQVFSLLQKDPDTKDWTVLHSLGLSRRGKKPYGEIDFVVLLPGEGVLCLEVKGGRLACNNGKWETTDRHGQTKILNRSPFLQAREGMFALRDAILKRVTSEFTSTLLFAYAVVLPDIVFSQNSPEWETWQVIDREVLKRSISNALHRLAREQRRLHPMAAQNEPSATTLRTIKQLLRPDFEMVVSRSTQIEDTEAKILRLTEEQYFTLDTLAENERCLVQGAAGTGKTMLALEYARRAAVTGQRILLICFNRLLGDWFERQLRESTYTQNLTAGSYFKLLREVILGSSIAEEFLEQEKREHTHDFFTVTYTDYGRLAVEENGEPYDLIVMDEAQDLLTPGVLEVLGCWVKGGPASGRWAIFGDFQRQAIFSKATGDELKQLLRTTATQFAKVPLSLNCRNTRNIGEETALLSGFTSPPYRMGQISGLPVDYRYYKSEEGQQVALSEVLKRLLTDGVNAADIVVISSYKLANSGIAGIDGGSRFCIKEIGESVSKLRIPVVRFATTHAFKGMESTVVIVCDVKNVATEEPQSLLYVAMSRARSQLIMLVHENTKPAIVESLRRKLQESWNRTQ